MTTRLQNSVTLDLPDDGVLPDLDALPGVATVGAPEVDQVDAVHFDTDGLDLTRAGVALRRCTGGSDPGWQLELPAEEGAPGRLVRHPLGRTTRTAPAPLNALVRAITLGARTSPVVRLSTRRTTFVLTDEHGTVLAQVADAVAGVEPLLAGADSPVRTWRQVQVTLVDGDRALLAAATKALRAAGARPGPGGCAVARALADHLVADADAQDRGPAAGAQPAGRAATAYLAAQTAELRLRDPQVRLDVEDAVHRMRVATRRLRSALATFRPLFDREVVETLRQELAWLASVLGAARDAEVLRAHLLGALDALPPEQVLGPVRERIDTTLQARYEAAHATAVRTLDGTQYLALLRALDAFVARPPQQKAAHRRADVVLPERVLHAADRVQDAAGQWRSAPDEATGEEALHEVRKAAKRARYAAESVRPVLGKPAVRVASTMKAITEDLGVHQDGAIAREALLALVADAQAAGEPTFTYGVLFARETAQAEVRTDAVPTLLQAARKASRKLSA